MLKEKISVIIPIYNVEKYLDRCMYSVLNQTYTNLEIIMVDDGSPDKCPIICDSYKEKDKRIKVIHKKNGGLSDARNAGIKKATGKYIMFVDSDDYININMIECLYNNLVKTNSDISICNFKECLDSNEDINKRENNNIKIFDNPDLFFNLYNDLAIQTVVAWNKIYKANIFDDIIYPKGKINEDEAIIHLILNKCLRIVYTDCKYYYYYQRSGSIMHNFKIELLDILDFYDERSKFFIKNKMFKLDKYNNYMICFQCANLYNKIGKQKNFQNEKKKLMKKIRIYGKMVLSDKSNSFIQKFVCILLIIHPNLLKVLSFLNKIRRE